MSLFHRGPFDSRRQHQIEELRHRLDQTQSEHERVAIQRQINYWMRHRFL